MKILLGLLIVLLIMGGSGITVSNGAIYEDFPGGFIEYPGSFEARTPLTQSQIQSFLPERGEFVFPAPYNTEGVRLTNSSDCNGGDCINYTGYSYWRNINNHYGGQEILILIGMDRSRGGDGPSLISYHRVTEEVVNLGPLFDESHFLSWATTEGWYFSATDPYSIYLNIESQMHRYDVVTHQFDLVFDVTTLLGSGYYIWQMHSSADDLVHSATVRDINTYEMLGCIVYSEETNQHDYFPKMGDFDECQIDKSGEWLLIKEDIDGLDGEDNRIINLQTGHERILLDRDGAAGHSDMGYGYMVASDNWANDANTQKFWDFNSPILEGSIVYRNSYWDVQAPAHISHSNADPNIAPEQQPVCGSSVNRINRPHSNEIICFKLDGSEDVLVVAPVMTDLDASGGGDDYSKSPKGNLDSTGNYFIWTSNMGGSRLDLFLVRVPLHVLGLSEPTEPPIVDPEPDPVVDPSPHPRDKKPGRNKRNYGDNYEPIRRNRYKN